MEDLVQQLRNVDRGSLADNDSARLLLLREAKALIDRLQKPHELIETLTFTYPFTTIALRVAHDAGILQSLSNTPQTCVQLAEKSGVQHTFIRRMLRMLASVGIVEAVSDDQYADNSISTALKDKTGVINGLFHFWPIGIEQLSKLPAYLRSINYVDPADINDTPFGHIMNSAGYWQYFDEHPEDQAHFDAYLAAIRKGQPSWLVHYPLNDILVGFDSSTVLCVDIGGGRGWDMACLSRALPAEYGQSRIVLQDRSSVIDEAMTCGLPTNIQLMPHDFFTTQPIQGARVYFMHSICHDWPDHEAILILSQIRSVMRPGYSKLLLLETVMPSCPKSITPRMAAMDLNMMCHFSALERSESQWRALLAEAGLQYRSFSALPGAHQGVIEAFCPGKALAGSEKKATGQLQL